VVFLKVPFQNLHLHKLPMEVKSPFQKAFFDEKVFFMESRLGQGQNCIFKSKQVACSQHFLK